MKRDEIQQFEPRVDRVAKTSRRTTCNNLNRELTAAQKESRRQKHEKGKIVRRRSPPKG